MSLCSCVVGRRYGRIGSSVHSVPRRVCDAVFHQKHEKIREFLDFHAIYPLLRECNLFLQSENHVLLTDPQLTREGRIDIVISWLPRCGRSDYLTPFVECLRNTADEVGEGHTELADLLEEQRDVELNLDRIVIAKRAVYAFLFLVVFILTALLAISLLLFLVILPPLRGSEHRIYGSATIALDSFVERRWLKSMDVAFDTDNSCSGQVAVIKGRNCSELPTVEGHVGFEDQPCQMHVEPGSSFNVTIPRNQTARTNLPNIWVTHTIDAYLKLYNQISPYSQKKKVHEYNCSKSYSDATCYSAKENLGSSVIFNVNKANFYCLLLTNSIDSSVAAPTPYGITWSYTNITYDFATIRDNNYPLLSPWLYVKERRPVSVPVSEMFDFSEKNCALFHFGCSDDFYKFSISNLVKRWDIPAMISAIYGLALVVLLSVLLPVRFCKAKKIAVDQQSEES